MPLLFWLVVLLLLLPLELLWLLLFNDEEDSDFPNWVVVVVVVVQTEVKLSEFRVKPGRVRSRFTTTTIFYRMYFFVRIKSQYQILS